MNDEIKIEKNVPIPGGRKSGAKKRIVSKMEVGDSILFSKSEQARSLYMALKRNGFESTIRACEDGFRVWKLEKTYERVEE